MGIMEKYNPPVHHVLLPLFVEGYVLSMLFVDN